MLTLCVSVCATDCFCITSTRGLQNVRDTAVEFLSTFEVCPVVIAEHFFLPLQSSLKLHSCLFHG
jgi:hypothetical protein